MSLSLVGLCLIIVIGIYFANNSLRHSRWFLIRRFTNWFPLGMTYSFLYMGRYNLTVAKTALGSLMSNQDFGWIFAAGTWVYALSFLINGPLVDKIGGKKGIIIAGVGAAGANLLLGALTYLVVMGRLHMNLLIPFCVLYALNMYFQSYGAVSIIKVKAYWFHVRERGVFGAIFGTLISFGVYFAFDWGKAIADMTAATAPAGTSWLQSLLRWIFVAPGQVTDSTWAVFFCPAAILGFWVLLDCFMIKDTPEEAGFPPFDTHDASSGKMDEKLSTTDLLGKVFLNPLMMLFAMVAVTVGVLRNGIMNWYTVFEKEVHQPEARFFVDNWGLLLCIFGIVGGFAGGMISDRLFQSRRGPPVVIFSGLMFATAIVMAIFLFRTPVIVGLAALVIVLAVTGVHSLMSGTAAADFGGRKAAATCSGLIDGCVYLGSGLQSVCVGYLSGLSWQWWPIFLAPFSLAGGLVALKFWHALPEATRKFNAEQKARGLPAITADPTP